MIIPPAFLLRHPLRCLWLACALLCATGPVAGAQQRTSLSGFVTDAETGESLIAANIFIAEIDRGASTNASGFYAIADLGTRSISRAVYVRWLPDRTLAT